MRYRSFAGLNHHNSHEKSRLFWRILTPIQFHPGTNPPIIKHFAIEYGPRYGSLIYRTHQKIWWFSPSLFGIEDGRDHIQTATCYLFTYVRAVNAQKYPCIYRNSIESQGSSQIVENKGVFECSPWQPPWIPNILLLSYCCFQQEARVTSHHQNHILTL